MANRINTKTARDSQTNAPAGTTITTPGQDWRWTVLKVSASYQGAGTGGVLQILSGAGVKWELDVDADTGVLEDFRYPLRCEPGDTLTVTLSAGGAGVVGRVNFQYALEQ